MGTPVEIIFYNDKDEETARFSAPRIRMKFLKTAIRLAREFGDVSNLTEEQADTLFDFIVDLFGGKFTREELEENVDLFEGMAVLQSVLMRANNFATQYARTNPTLQSPKPK
jgi:hypothetical protein